jgi:hypothetical protein
VITAERLQTRRVLPHPFECGARLREMGAFPG